MGSIDIRRHSRRRKSVSYTDSLISDDDSSVTAAASIPSTPLRYLGIPFSWEQFPGIPKKNTYKKDESSQNLLPPPPSSITTHQSQSPTMMMMKKKNKSSQNFRKDPFFAALVECSKDNNKELEEMSKGSAAGFVVSMLYSSCKRTCAVSESIVYRRRSPADYL
ncbi:hypothetical protein L6452_39072 [Arctium lappa]|uniref:Uncharacterized protein n=1 Tax=Arctium lappa TaxID=4217 RepID=A0ACB8XQP0_ARCLA|nr:hypothetical protein L6452_39072 [Arctium lappa]